MEFSVSFLPLGNTTEREIVALTQEVHDVLRRAPGVGELGPVLRQAPEGAKGGVFEVVGSFLLSATPAAVKQLLPMLKAVLMRPGQPMTEVVFQDRASKVTFKFNPKDIPLQDLVDGVLRLRAGTEGS